VVSKVGFIGLGTMGKPIVVNIARAGFDLMVYDVRKEPVRVLSASNAKVARSVKEIAEHGELIEIVVLDDAQVEAVLVGETGVLAAAKPGTLVAIHSTVLPRTLKAIVEKAAAKDIIVVDAPISGGQTGVCEKRLCYRVGGTRDAVDKCREVFGTSGTEIVHLGDAGTGTVAKIHQSDSRLYQHAGDVRRDFNRREGRFGFTVVAAGHPSQRRSELHGGSLFERIKRVAQSPQALRHQWEGLYKTLSVALESANDLSISLPGTALTQQLLAKIVGYKEVQ